MSGPVRMFQQDGIEVLTSSATLETRLKPLLQRADCRRGFTLIELLIVLIMMGILAVPMAQLLTLPYRANSTFTDLNRTSAACGNLVDHLSDDIRCADVLVAEKGEEGTRLRIERAGEAISYQKNEAGVLVREVSGEVPLVHSFPGISASFEESPGTRLKTMEVDLVVRYPLLKAPVEKKRSLRFCSHLEVTP